MGYRLKEDLGEACLAGESYVLVGGVYERTREKRFGKDGLYSFCVLPKRIVETSPLFEKIEELKPCPFCGGTPHEKNDMDCNGYYIVCENCGARVGGIEFKAKWDRRIS